MQVYAAALLYSGGTVSGPYKDDNVWRTENKDYIRAFSSSTGVLVPQKYYRMFVETYFPTIVSVSAAL
ncbi:MAG: hypothetical protein QXH64_03780 [Nitrososphaeria archaeon]